MINTYIDRKNVPIALTATKIDLLKGDLSTLEGPNKYAIDKGWLFCKTSAKNNIGVNELFEELICKHLNVPLYTPSKQVMTSTRQLHTGVDNTGRIFSAFAESDATQNNHGKDGNPFADANLKKGSLGSIEEEKDKHEGGGLLSKIMKICCG